MRWPLPWILVFAIALSACQRGGVPLPQDVYVWQRQWTPALRDALRESRPLFSAYRVLAAETDRGGALQPVRPDLAALAAQHAPVVAVLRLNGSDPPPDATALAARVRDVASDWRAAGVALIGIEIDHDCATARLSDYARLLAALRAELPRGLRLSITALPAWNGSGALRDVLAAVDESVLQVHAVSGPAAGLFDPAAARRWIAAYAAAAPKPFRVALPAYGMRVDFDAAGRALQVAAETPRAPATDDARELEAAPADVAPLLRALERERPANLAGVVWFRLPSAEDRRAWSLATLRAVIAGAPLAPALAARVEPAADGARDVLVLNRGALDAPAPRTVRVLAQACSAADGVNGFRAEAEDGGWRFVADGSVPLRAGRERRIGWLRCGDVEKVTIR